MAGPGDHRDDQTRDSHDLGCVCAACVPSPAFARFACARVRGMPWFLLRMLAAFARPCPCIPGVLIFAVYECARPRLALAPHSAEVRVSSGAHGGAHWDALFGASD